MEAKSRIVRIRVTKNGTYKPTPTALSYILFLKTYGKQGRGDERRQQQPRVMCGEEARNDSPAVKSSLGR